ncbi:MAG: hypothetical protein A2939_01350 [Parcubacteria group bacterium RIFCSPLOWO2_01_FULL_48_18]|nr:MAG: hypothetical protein A2939_01350 [Parcubacteria group bacterium RIFCSPLOWO2_01_FULL_48_18]OHB23872.1 MAG: hypothetical protein A3J67_03255 [Parcubacteria group bacterium RIFCSPHIGHO2_02_FULL_48_10b]
MELQAQTREKFGKAVSLLLKTGLIPAELYGRGLENLHLAVKKEDFAAVYRQAGENTIVNLKIGAETKPTLIYNVQRDPISDSYRHIDFYQVRMDETIKTEVPLVFIGESSAVKSLGGVLVKTMKALPIESLPGDLPREIGVDLAALKELDSTFYVKDLELPKGVKPTVGPETAVVSVVAPATEEEIKPTEEVTVESVKVETEEKKAQRETAKKEGESS